MTRENFRLIFEAVVYTTIVANLLYVTGTMIAVLSLAGLFLAFASLIALLGWLFAGAAGATSHLKGHSR